MLYKCTGGGTGAIWKDFPTDLLSLDLPAESEDQPLSIDITAFDFNKYPVIRVTTVQEESDGSKTWPFIVNVKKMIDEVPKSVESSFINHVVIMCVGDDDNISFYGLKLDIQKSLNILDLYSEGSLDSYMKEKGQIMKLEYTDQELL